MATASRRDGKRPARTARNVDRKRTAASKTLKPVQQALGCRSHEVLARVGDKWSVYVIHVLADAGTLRFGELRKRIEGISQRSLTVTLRSLERDGLISRAMYPEVPPRVEYSLTPLAMTLRRIVSQLVEWSQGHLAAIDTARARYDSRRAAWVGADE